MRRTQIQLDEKTWETLRERAFRERRSVAQVVREMLLAHFREAVTPRGISSFAFIGSGVSRGSGRGRVSERHDEALAEAFKTGRTP